MRNARDFEIRALCAFVFDGFCADSKITGYDFVITLGGDGTVLFAARNTAHSPIPIFPVNFGQFGFIASVQPEEWKEELENFLSDPERDKIL